MRIIQITDIHVDKVGELTNNINTQVNFLEVLDKSLTYQPDLYVLSGDLCHKDGVVETYQWFKSRMDVLNIPYFVMPGNHDDSQKMADVFQYECKNGELYYEIEKNGQKLLFLDSGKATMSDDQYTWLSQRLDENTLIFMHHPPCIVGVPHMDEKYKFQEIERFQALISTKTTVFCGHCHTERSIQLGPLSVFVTPSCFVQIGDKSEIFEAEHYKPAYRLIDVDAGGMVNTTVKYIF